MTKRKWHKGPPPHIGWWNASHCNNEGVWRWWNGDHWSDFAIEMNSAHSASISASLKGLSTSLIKWTDYWPKNARVERTKP